MITKIGELDLRNSLWWDEGMKLAERISEIGIELRVLRSVKAGMEARIGELGNEKSVLKSELDNFEDNSPDDYDRMKKVAERLETIKPKIEELTRVLEGKG